jgi:hypothetical protein
MVCMALTSVYCTALSQCAVLQGEDVVKSMVELGALRPPASPCCCLRAADCSQ